MILTEKLSAYTPFQFCHGCGIVMRGRMAEWSIAAVLKTAGLTAPGVRIPLLPFEGISSTAIDSGIKCMFLSNIPGYSSWFTMNQLGHGSTTDSRLAVQTSVFRSFA